MIILIPRIIGDTAIIEIGIRDTFSERGLDGRCWDLGSILIRIIFDSCPFFGGDVRILSLWVRCYILCFIYVMNYGINLSN